MKHVDVVVGNSSSALIEALSFPVGTLNIGDRQRGRIRADSVVDCGYSTTDILAGLKILYSDRFMASLKGVKNPYGDGGVAEEILNRIREHSFENILKKTFNDISQLC
jgi:GDP/UDP-N,N'-diacetylbacillosamine 2-epimerase (hydrolysing)